MRKNCASRGGLPPPGFTSSICGRAESAVEGIANSRDDPVSLLVSVYETVRSSVAIFLVSPSPFLFLFGKFFLGTSPPDRSPVPVPRFGFVFC